MRISKFNTAYEDLVAGFEMYQRQMFLMHAIFDSVENTAQLVSIWFSDYSKISKISKCGYYVIVFCLMWTCFCLQMFEMFEKNTVALVII